MDYFSLWTADHRWHLGEISRGGLRQKRWARRLLRVYSSRCPSSSRASFSSAWTAAGVAATSALGFVRPRPLFCSHAECVADNSKLAAASLWVCVKSPRERWRRAESVSRLGLLKGSQLGCSLAHFKSANVSQEVQLWCGRRIKAPSEDSLITTTLRRHIFSFSFRSECVLVQQLVDPCPTTAAGRKSTRLFTAS